MRILFFLFGILKCSRIYWLIARYRQVSSILTYFMMGTIHAGKSFDFPVFILFSGHPGISVNELSPLSLRRWNIRHFKFDFHRLKMADSLLLEEVTSPRKREFVPQSGKLTTYFCSSVFSRGYMLYDFFVYLQENYVRLFQAHHFFFIAFTKSLNFWSCSLMKKFQSLLRTTWKK